MSRRLFGLLALNLSHFYFLLPDEIQPARFFANMLKQMKKKPDRKDCLLKKAAQENPTSDLTERPT